jgi:hypothetical protein
VRPAKSAAVKRGFSFHRCGHAQVVECVELPVCFFQMNGIVAQAAASRGCA